MKKITAALLAALSLQGCVAYHSSMTVPGSEQTSVRVDESKAQAKRKTLTISGETITVVETLEGPEESVLRYRQYEYQRHWSPALIPVGVLMVVLTPLSGLMDFAEPTDQQIFWVNGRHPDCPAVVPGSFDVLLGIWPWTDMWFCGPDLITRDVFISEQTKTRATGKKIVEERPVAGVSVTVDFKGFDSSGNVLQTAGPQNLVTGPDGTVKYDRDGALRLFGSEPARVGVEARLWADLSVMGLSEIAPASIRSYFSAQRRAKDSEAAAAREEQQREEEAARSARERAAREKAADAARGSGRFAEALDLFAALLKDAPSGTETALRDKMIATALAMPEPPATPEEAKHRFNRARAFVKAGDFAASAEEFKLAAAAAPWWAPAYYNLALVQEKTREFDAAISNLQIYLKAAPGAADAEAVKAKIDELGVFKEKSGAR